MKQCWLERAVHLLLFEIYFFSNGSHETWFQQNCCRGEGEFADSRQQLQLEFQDILQGVVFVMHAVMNIAN